MPLEPGSSPEVVSQNIREMQASGHPHNVAVAASLHNADKSGGRRRKRKAGGDAAARLARARMQMEGGQ
jgi:hypothetical protein